MFKQGDVVESKVRHITDGGPICDMLIEKGDLIRIAKCEEYGFLGETEYGTCMSGRYKNYQHTNREFVKRW